MKKDFIRTCGLTLALVLSAAVTMPGMAEPATAAQPSSFLAMPIGTQSTLAYAPLAEEDECAHLNHDNFCYCTGACSHAD